MRKTFFLALFLLGSSAVFARVDSMVVRNKWCTRTDTIVLYKDGWNMLQVFGGDTNPNEVRFKSYDSDLRFGAQDVKKDTLCAYAMPFATGQKMKMAVVNKKTGRVIKEVYCISDSMPEPVAVVGFLKSNTVTKKDLLAQSLLRVTYPHSDYSYPYKILSYTFKAYKDPASVTKAVEGTFIPLDIQKIIKDLKPGTALVFSDIIAVCPDCNSRKLKDIKLVIQ